MPKTSAARGRLAAIVLAAGGSSRLGRPKQLLRQGTRPLIVRMSGLAREAGAWPVIVVLGADRLRLRSVLRRHGLAPRIACNARWAEGMAGSLRAGLKRVPDDAVGALILLVDQAALGADDLGRLAAAWRRRPGRPAAAAYAGRVGAPAIIPRRYFRRLGTLEGDVGARRLLRTLGSVTPVAIPGAAFDIDTPEDAAALSARTRPGGGSRN